MPKDMPRNRQQMHQCESDDHVNVVSESDRYSVSVEVWVTGLARSWPARLYFTHSQYKLLTVYLYLELTRTTAGCCSKLATHLSALLS